MITNEIQELLEGSISDERTAELLHVLAVSPEKRAAFRDHLTLGSAMLRDRNASALTSDEDAAIWGAIVGTGSGAVVTAPTQGLLWKRIATAAAVVVAGLTGYLVAPDAPEATQRAAQPAAIERKAPATSSAAGTAGSALDGTSAPGEVKEKVVYRDRIVYRDRVIYKERPSVAAASSLADATATSSNPQNTNVLNAGADHSTDPTSTSTSVGLGGGASSLGDPHSRATTPESPIPTNTLHPDTAGTTPANQAAIIDPNGVLDPNSVLANIPQDPIANASETPNPLRMNGFEVALTDRVGMLALTPSQVETADRNISTRTADIAYRFMDGALGIGARAAYGAFTSASMVSTEDRTGQATEGVYTRRLDATQLFWIEGFGSYRLPITDRIGVGAEVSIGGWSGHLKFGGDIMGTFFITERFGIQAGGGVGYYSYNLVKDRELLLEELKASGKTGGFVDGNDRDDGVTFHGRYGLFIRF